MRKEILSSFPVILLIFVKASIINVSTLNERQQFYKAHLDLLCQPLIVIIEDKRYIKYQELKKEFSQFVLDNYGDCRLEYYPKENFIYIVSLEIKITTKYEKIVMEYHI